MDRITILINFINSSHYSNNLENDSFYYYELLQLSKEHNNLYGQALAHIKLAQLYHYAMSDTQFAEHSLLAKEIASQNEYFDILLQYYNIEGLYYMRNLDDMNALTMYLKGLDIATATHDGKFNAIYYNNIAEIFYANHEYENAVTYYLKALHICHSTENEEIKQYHKTILINLIISSCLNHDLQSAKQFMIECQTCECDGIHPFAQSEAEIRIMMLEQNDKESLTMLNSLLQNVKNSKLNKYSLLHIYIFMCEAYLDFRKKDEVYWCIEQIDMTDITLHPSFIMKFQKLKILCHQIFCDSNTSLYENFYFISMQQEQILTNMIATSLNASLSFYVLEKNQEQITREKEHMMELAMYDELTGVYNRYYYRQFVSKCLADVGIISIAYIMIDIDYFKEYNDYYGHQNGDFILKTVANVIDQMLPSDASLSRFGGDEFTCLLLNKELQEIENFIKSVQTKIKEVGIEHIKARNMKQLTLSLGAYYTNKEEGLTSEILIKHADDALYQVKKNGRNGYVIFSD